MLSYLSKGTHPQNMKVVDTILISKNHI
jgi:hypothetical protein